MNILICLKAKVQMLVSSVGMIMTSELLRPLRVFWGWGMGLGLTLDFATCPNEYVAVGVLLPQRGNIIMTLSIS